MHVATLAVRGASERRQSSAVGHCASPSNLATPDHAPNGTRPIWFCRFQTCVLAQGLARQEFHREAHKCGANDRSRIADWNSNRARNIFGRSASSPAFCHRASSSLTRPPARRNLGAMVCAMGTACWVPPLAPYSAMCVPVQMAIAGGWYRRSMFGEIGCTRTTAQNYR